MTQEQILDAIKEMTVLQLNDLVKAIEEEFGVTAAAPVAAAAGGGSTGRAGAELRRGALLHLPGLLHRDVLRDHLGLHRLPDGGSGGRPWMMTDST